MQLYEFPAAVILDYLHSLIHLAYDAIGHITAV